MLQIENIHVAIQSVVALRGLTLTVADGTMVGLVGRNGAGKTTLMRTVMGHLVPSQGRITFDGQDLAAMPAHLRVAQGIVQVPEGRRLFPFMTVHENLLLGAHAAQARAQQEASLDHRVAGQPIEPDAVEQDLPRPRAQQAGDGPQHGGLARRVGAHQGHQLARAHLEADPVEGLEVAVERVHALKRQQTRTPLRDRRRPRGGRG